MRTHRWVLGFFALLILVGSVSAQTEACQDVLDLAINALDLNCAGTERNSACYGYNNVSAQFFEVLPDDAFDLPADVVDVPQIASISTLPYDPETETWGVALMNIQANLPNTFPGQGVVFVLMGDTNVNNAVDPDTAFVAGDGITVTPNTRANLRSGPDQRNNVLMVVDAGTELAADAVSANGNWVRVLYEDRQAWISRELIGEDLSELPVYDEDAFTPMQAFYLTTGVGATDCQSAPDTLLIQGPQNTEITFTVNGADIRIGSTVLLETLMGDGSVMPSQLQISVLDGEAFVDNLIVPEGFKAFVDLEETETDNGLLLPAVQDEWESCAPLDEADRARIGFLSNLPPSVLYYPVTEPEETDALCASPEEIAAQQAAQRQSACGDTFRPTSPLGGMAFASQTFYWDPATNAARYRVTVYNLETGGVASFDTLGAETSLTADLANSGLGGSYSVAWDVQALDGAGNAICTTDQAVMQREAAPIQTQPYYLCISYPMPTPSGNCSYVGYAQPPCTGGQDTFLCQP
jgi:hypothetical protein